MSSSDRRAVLIGLAGLSTVGLGACFRPLLRQEAGAPEIRHRIALPTVEGRMDYYLVETLEDRLGEPVDPDYRIELVTTVTERGLAVSQDDAVTRVSVLAHAAWTLWRAGESEPLISDLAYSEASYNATGSLFATRVTRRDIEQRLARDLGERIARSILARAEVLAN